MDGKDALSLAGELCIAAAAEQQARLREAAGQARGALALDLAGIDACDSAGVQLLLATRRTLAQRGLALHLAAPSAPVRQALQTYGLLPLFGLEAA